MNVVMHDTFTSFGELLRYLRQRACLTQRALGQAVNYTGAHITHLENGMRRPNPAVVRARFIDALDLQDEPALAQRLIALAVAADPETPDALQHLSGPSAPAATPRRTNLPVQLTSFIGRELEMAEVTRQLGPGGTRLLTITGIGGAGKTRLAIEVGTAFTQAAAQGTDLTFADGIWLVELAPLSDPAGVPRAVKEALHLPDELERSPTEVLIEYLTPRCLLLLLDNCEQLISACAELAQVLLSVCPHLRILATSREALRCPGEVVWRIPPLMTPDPDSPLALEQVAAYEAVLLFTERALTAQPDFRLTQANAPAVARICARLDGIPLAIEMAAARTAAMSAQEIAARLDDRFTLLTSGWRAAPPRQRTLHATLEWSYNLLDEPERMLFARLSVFVDGCTAELAQTVCADGDRDEQAESASIAPSLPSSVVLRRPEVLPLLIGLVSKSLVVADTREESTRYRLLETVRQYAAEKLAERGETDILYLRLATHLTQPAMVIGGFYAPDWWHMFLPELGNVRNLVVWARSKRGYADIILRAGLHVCKLLAYLWLCGGTPGLVGGGARSRGDCPDQLACDGSLRKADASHVRRLQPGLLVG